MNELATKAMVQFFKANPPVIFQPAAYHDADSNCIRALRKDCSFTEIRLNKIFNILWANHMEKIEYAGFEINAARHFLKELRTLKPEQISFTLGEMIEFVAELDSASCSDLIQREFADIMDLKILMI